MVAKASGSRHSPPYKAVSFELSFYSISTPSTRHVFMTSAQAMTSLQHLSVTVEAATCVEISKGAFTFRPRLVGP